MRLLFCAPMLLVAALLCSAQTERALLIGIKTYQPEGTTAEHPAGCAYGRCELGRFDNLKCESGGLAHIASVADPAEQPWTNMLSWDGTNWTLRHAAAPSAAAGGSVVSGTKEWRAVAPVKLGAKLTAAALQQHLPAGAKVWVNLLPSSAMAAKLALHDSNSAVRAAPELANANYILVGALPDKGPAYAWLHKIEFVAGPHATIATDHSPGCSATSQYPVRSDWVSFPRATANADGAAALNRYASLLGKVHGWLQLADSPSGASAEHYYRLAVGLRIR